MSTNDQDCRLDIYDPQFVLTIPATISVLCLLTLVYLLYGLNVPNLRRHPTTLIIPRVWLELLFVQQYLWMSFVPRTFLWSDPFASSATFSPTLSPSPTPVFRSLSHNQTLEHWLPHRHPPYTTDYPWEHQPLDRSLDHHLYDSTNIQSITLDQPAAQQRTSHSQSRSSMTPLAASTDDGVDHNCDTNPVIAPFCWLTQFSILGAELFLAALSLDIHVALTNPFSSSVNDAIFYRRVILVFSMIMATILVSLRPIQFGVSADPMLWIKGKTNIINWVKVCMFYMYIPFIYSYSGTIMIWARWQVSRGLKENLKTRKYSISKQTRFVIGYFCFYVLLYTFQFLLYMQERTGSVELGHVSGGDKDGKVLWQWLLWTITLWSINNGEVRENTRLFRSWCAFLLATRGIWTFNIFLWANASELYAYFYGKPLTSKRPGVSTSSSQQEPGHLPSPSELGSVIPAEKEELLELNIALQKEIVRFTTFGIQKSVREAQELTPSRTSSSRSTFSGTLNQLFAGKLLGDMISFLMNDRDPMALTEAQNTVAANPVHNVTDIATHKPDFMPRDEDDLEKSSVNDSTSTTSMQLVARQRSQSDECKANGSGSEAYVIGSFPSGPSSRILDDIEMRSSFQQGNGGGGLRSEEQVDYDILQHSQSFSGHVVLHTDRFFQAVPPLPSSASLSPPEVAVPPPPTSTVTAKPSFFSFPGHSSPTTKPTSLLHPTDLRPAAPGSPLAASPRGEQRDTNGISLMENESYTATHPRYHTARSMSTTSSLLLRSLVAPFRMFFPPKNSFRFTDFSPLKFAKIRELSGIKAEQYISSFNSTTMPNFSEGRSGAFVYFTSDRQFLVKTTTRAEMDHLLSLLPHYLAYLSRQPDSLLTRYLGAHRIIMYDIPIYFVVMKNIVSDEIDEKFDLKGSWINRHGTKKRKDVRLTRPKKSKKMLSPGSRERRVEAGQEAEEVQTAGESAIQEKTSSPPQFLDNDLQNCFMLPVALAKRLAQQLQRDTAFLAKFNLMDYSLLVGVKRQTFPLQIRNITEPPRHRSSFSAFDLSVPPAQQPPLPPPSDEQKLNDALPAAQVEGAGVYYLGLIDLLQQWDWNKWSERMLKTLVLGKDGSGISAIEPKQYRQRFLQRAVIDVFDELTNEDLLPEEVMNEELRQLEDLLWQQQQQQQQQQQLAHDTPSENEKNRLHHITRMSMKLMKNQETTSPTRRKREGREEENPGKEENSDTPKETMVIREDMV